GTAAATTSTIDTGSGQDTVAIGGPHGLDDIAGPLAVHGTGTVALVFNDQPDPRNDAYTLTATKLSRPGFSFTYSTVAALTLNAGPGNSTFTVAGTAAGTATTLNAGGGNDTIRVGGAGRSLGGIQGALTINGQAGNDTLTLNDQRTNPAETYTITSTTVDR